MRGEAYIHRREPLPRRGTKGETGTRRAKWWGVWISTKLMEAGGSVKWVSAVREMSEHRADRLRGDGREDPLCILVS